MCRRSFMAHSGPGGIVCSGSSSSSGVDTSWPTRGPGAMARPDSVMMSPGFGGREEAGTASPHSCGSPPCCSSPWPVIGPLLCSPFGIRIRLEPYWRFGRSGTSTCLDLFCLFLRQRIQTSASEASSASRVTREGRSAAKVVERSNGRPFSNHMSGPCALEVSSPPPLTQRQTRDRRFRTVSSASCLGAKGGAQ